VIIAMPFIQAADQWLNWIDCQPDHFVFCEKERWLFEKKKVALLLSCDFFI